MTDAQRRSILLDTLDAAPSLPVVPDVNELCDELIAANQKLHEIAIRLGPSHPVVVDLIRRATNETSKAIVQLAKARTR